MYLLVETAAGLEIIDQHIAHERILYERLRREFAESGIVRQLFLLPARVELPFEAAAVLASGLEKLARAGVVLEEFGGGTFLLQGVPAGSGRRSDASRIPGRRRSASSTCYARRATSRRRCSTASSRELACGAAIKAGDRIPLIEAQALVDQWMLQENPYSCPHGRPIVFAIDRAELDRKFGR